MIHYDIIPKAVLKSSLVRKGWQMNKENRKGQGLVEYALIMVLVATVIIVILALMGPSIGNVFSNVVGTLKGTSIPTNTPTPTQAPPILYFANYENGKVWVDKNGNGLYEEVPVPEPRAFVFDVEDGNCYVAFGQINIVHLPSEGQCKHNKPSMTPAQ